MVSGHGVRGGRGRCFTLFRDFMSCAAQNGSYGAGTCTKEREDYMECLHHTRLGARLEAIEKEKIKLIKEGKWPPPTNK